MIGYPVKFLSTEMSIWHFGLVFSIKINEINIY
jgi:hypothetical protein